MPARNSSQPYVIVGLGEVLWDVFPEGPKFGGAPANFACTAAELAGDAAEVFMVSAIGRDDLGERALSSLSDHRVLTDHVAVNAFPTGRVDVTVDSAGVASYRFAEDVAWDHLEWSADLENLAARTNAVCFGTLAQRTRESSQTVLRFVAATPAESLRIFDINLRSPYWTYDVIMESLMLANILKLNDDELKILSERLGISGDPVQQLEQINLLFSLDLTALTRGSKGSLLVDRRGQVSDLPGEPVGVVDTVGAGDAFTAALTVGLLQGASLEETHRWASCVAAYVCSVAGAAPHLPETIRRRGS